MPHKPTIRLAALIALATTAALPQPAAADTINFTNQGTFTTSTLQLNNVTITALSSPGNPGTVNVLNLAGLGVVGGIGNTVVDTAEALTFSFNTFLGADVSYSVFFASNGNGNGTVGDAIIEAFGPNGISLGTVNTTSGSLMSVSSRFGNQLISGFKVQANGDLHRIGLLTFTRVTEVHWRDTTTGLWDVSANWAPTVVPIGVLDTFIDPTIGQTVTGPATGSIVKSLTIGAQTAGTAVLYLQSTGALLVNETTTLTPRGRITGNGSLHATLGITNGGEIDLGVASLTLSGGTLSNSGLVRGNGQIDNDLTNAPTGEIRADANRRILFSGSTNTNDGNINLFDGTVEFKNGLTNSALGVIAGEGKLITGTQLDNAGAIALTGPTQVLGDVVNTGTVIISGAATVTFFDDVMHDESQNANALFRVSAGATAVFLGAFSVNGSVDGANGAVLIEGDLRPGSSPGTASFEGNLATAPTTRTQIEIAGLARGVDYDTIHVGGTLSLAGELDVQVIDGFALGPNQAFDILHADAGITGQFNGLTDGDRVGAFSGNDLFIGYSFNNVTLFTVPEPGTLAPFVITAVALLLRRGSRAIA